MNLSQCGKLKEMNKYENSVNERMQSTIEWKAETHGVVRKVVANRFVSHGSLVYCISSHCKKECPTLVRLLV